jgi:hypothetical protein
MATMLSRATIVIVRAERPGTTGARFESVLTGEVSALLLNPA